MTSNLDLRGISAFTISACGLAWLACLPLWLSDEGIGHRASSLVLPLMMLTPSVATALVIVAVSPLDAKLKSLGLGLGVRPWRYWASAWVVVPLFSVAALFVGAIFGVYPLDIREFSGFREQIVAAGAEDVLERIPILALVVLQLLQAVVLAPVLNCVFALGEELGWRGYLLPKLLPLGQWPALVISGIVWGLWHAPIVLLGHNYPQRPILGVFLMIAFCVIFGILFGWTRIATGSVWPAVIAHGALNGSAGLAALCTGAGVTFDTAQAGITGWTGWIVPILWIFGLALTHRLPVPGAPDVGGTSNAWGGKNAARSQLQSPSATDPVPMIVARGLTKQFGDTAVIENLSFTVHTGEVVGILGPNGAGKTTTVRMLACLISPSAGEASVCGYPVGEANSAIRRQIGILTETPGLYNSLSAARNLEVFARLYGVADPAAQVEKYLRLLGLWDRRDEAAGTFSKGMKQKLAIARALVHEPRLLFLDEPTSGLDPQMTKTIREFLEELRSEGRTILLCTHNLDEAERLCDRVAVLNSRLLAMDRPTALRRRLFTRTTVVRLRSVSESLVKLIRGLDFVTSAQVVEDQLLVTVDDPSQRNPEIVRQLVEAGGEVIAIAEHKHSLEDVYLRLIDEEQGL